MYNDIDYELTKKGIYTSRAGLSGGLTIPSGNIKYMETKTRNAGFCCWAQMRTRSTMPTIPKYISAERMY